MDEIQITGEGKVLSHIYSGEKIEEIAGYLNCYPAIFIVCDKNLSYLEDRVITALSPGHTGKLHLKEIDCTEEGKNIFTVLDICSFLLDSGASRDALLLSIGGGIASDIAGFAASIYKRGIHFAYIPTTLLAQVDAGLGGKTGINFLSYKNMLGVIRQPDFTFECAEVLLTLSERDFISGSAEMLKTFILDNRGGNYEKAVTVLSEIQKDYQGELKKRLPELLRLIHECAAIKAGVVSRDANERGERKLLNLGHTFAHAIESEDQRNSNPSAATHGEAVAIGIILAAKLSVEKGLAREGLCAQLIRDFSACGLPTETDYSTETLHSAMRKDKKADDEGKVRFILLEDIGKPVTMDIRI